MNSKKAAVLTIIIATFVMVLSVEVQVLAVEKMTEHSQSQQKSLTVVTEPGYYPFEFIKDGEIVGFDIDVLREVEKRTNLKFTVKQMAFNSIIGSVTNETVDLAIAGMCITPERSKQVYFSTPTYVVKAKPYVLAYNNPKYSSFQSFSGKSIGTQDGTVFYFFLRDNYADTIKIVPFSTNAIGIKMLESNVVDAILLGDEQRAIIPTGMKTIDIYTSNQDEYAILFPKTKAGKELLDIFNNAISLMEKDGTLTQLQQNWFGGSANVTSVASSSMLEESKFGGSKELEENKNTKNSSIYIVYIKSIIKIFYGAIVSVQYAACSIIFSLFGGICVAILRVIYKNSLTNKVLACYISIIRGTPLLLQISIIYFCLPALFHQRVSIFTSGVLALSINSTAYMAEIIRAGINSIDIGQTEAATALNLTRFQLYKDILLPQVMKKVLPAIIGELITLLKETSLVSVFGEAEIMRSANSITSEYYEYFIPLITAGVYYWFLSFIIELVGRKFSKSQHYIL